MTIHQVGQLGADSKTGKPTVAVIGSGISGLSAAYHLRQEAEVTLFEANDYIGGHTHTIDIDLEGTQYPVDTGFLVFNERTYPELMALFKTLEVETALSDMSFGVCIPDIGLEWAGTNLNTVFAQRKNILRPSFLIMLADILRFNKQATRIMTIKTGKAENSEIDYLCNKPLGEFLKENRYSKFFKNWYLLPMAAAIWSCPSEQMLAFPVVTFLRFCHNHGLLQVDNRPRWFTVKGGARCYVEKILPHIAHIFKNTPITAIDSSGIKPMVHTRQTAMAFDAIVLACHSDQSLQLLPTTHTAQLNVLKNIRYQNNIALLHTDTALLPKHPAVRSSWNYFSHVNDFPPRVSVTYWLNRLQPMPFKTPVLLTLNPITQPKSDQVIRTLEYSHPVFDGSAIEAQGLLPQVQGHGSVYLAGAWAGCGFHEDGYKSGKAAAAAVLRDFQSLRATVAVA